nr:uncharacterized protein LOC117221855 [Megalopta genalis]
MQQLTKEQELTIGGLCRILPNFKHLGKAKFSKAAAEERLCRLRTEWDSYRLLHLQLELKATAEDRESRDYFAQGYFKRAKTEFEQASDFFVELVTSFRSGASALADAGQRLQHFKGALEGEAASEVAHYSVTAANFGIAWAALVRRYDQLVVSALLSSFLALAPLSRDRDGSGLALLRRRTNEALPQLKNLGRPVDHWDDLLVHLTVEKLDPKSREVWIHELRMAPEPSTVSAERRPAQPPPPVRSHAIVTTAASRCRKCGDNHPLFRCPAFRGVAPNLRREFVRTRCCCFNCLRSEHPATSCSSASCCSICNGSHHTLIHQDPGVGARPDATAVKPGRDSTTNISGPQLRRTRKREQGRTARDRSSLGTVTRRGEGGGSKAAEDLMDQGSEATFVSQSLVQALRIPKRPAAITVTGAGDVPVGRVNSRIDIVLRLTERGNAPMPHSVHVLRRLTAYASKATVDVRDYPHLQDLVLADPDPTLDLLVDLLIVADCYGDVIGPGLRRGTIGQPIAHESVFGWDVSGATSTPANDPDSSVTSLHCRAEERLEQQLRFALGVLGSEFQVCSLP